MEIPEYLFIGTYSNAYVYADRTVETNRDYHLIARVIFRPLELKIYDYAEKYRDAIERATADYEYIKANINTPIITTECGQSVLPCLPDSEK